MEFKHHPEDGSFFYWNIVSVSFLAASTEDCDCFAVFILTHGDGDGKVFGTDQSILVSRLISHLKEDLPILVGKPKMLFVQVQCSDVDVCRVTNEW